MDKPAPRQDLARLREEGFGRRQQQQQRMVEEERPALRARQASMDEREKAVLGREAEVREKAKALGESQRRVDGDIAYAETVWEEVRAEKEDLLLMERRKKNHRKRDKVEDTAATEERQAQDSKHNRLQIVNNAPCPMCGFSSTSSSSSSSSLPDLMLLGHHMHQTCLGILGGLEKRVVDAADRAESERLDMRLQQTLRDQGRA